MSLESLARARNDAAKAVRDWMTDQGRNHGRLRHNSEAPGWPAYEAAQRALDEALSAVGREQTKEA